MVSAKALSGINPLSYMGVEPYTPVPLFVRSFAPTSNDAQNFNIGTVWLVTGNSIPEEIWFLVSLQAGIATWVQLYPGGGGGGGANEFPCDSGTANEAGGILNIFGDGSFITTTGSGNTVTISLNDDFSTTYDTDSGTAIPSAGVIVIHGGTNMNTSGATNVVTINLNPSINLAGSLIVGTTSLFTGNATFDGGVNVSSFTAGVVQSDGSGNLFESKGLDGQILIGSTVGAPAWNRITSMDGSVTITNGSNSIDLASSGGGGGTNCAFQAYQAANQSGLFISSSSYTLGTAQALTVSFDVGSNFYPGNGIGSPARFTAPITGKYYLQLNVRVTNSPHSGSTTTAIATIVTPARPYQSRPFSFIASNGGEADAPISVCADLISGDVVTFIAGVQGSLPPNGGGVQGSIGAAGNLVTFCSGFLVGAGSSTNPSVITTTFTSSGVWDANSSTKMVEVMGWSAGGGGAGGSCNATQGGGGGGNPGFFWLSGPAAYFGASQVITIGAGGAGGAGTSVNGAAGSAGSNGGVTSFGVISTPTAVGQVTSPSSIHTGGGITGFPGLVGERGYYGDYWTDSVLIGSTRWVDNTTPASGTGGDGSNGYNGIAGASLSGTSVNTSATSLLQSINSYAMGSGGGGGAAINTSSPAIFSGGVGGGKSLPSGALLAGGTAGNESSTIDGGDGADGNSAAGIVVGGCGGGGGGNQFAGGRGGDGGNGGFPGGGGGGGGASTVGSNSGSGGNGGAGQLIVIEYL